jgi:hypothetical protein
MSVLHFNKLSWFNEKASKRNFTKNKIAQLVIYQLITEKPTLDNTLIIIRGGIVKVSLSVIYNRGLLSLHCFTSENHRRNPERHGQGHPETAEV